MRTTDFWKRTIKIKDCWIWTGMKQNGYAAIWEGSGVKNRKSKAVHRIIFELVRGTIPRGYVIDHTCMNRACLNPKHLRAVTRGMNNVENSSSIAAKHARKTHCIRGHVFDQENTHIRPNGSRDCRVCRKMHNKFRDKGVKHWAPPGKFVPYGGRHS